MNATALRKSINKEISDMKSAEELVIPKMDKILSDRESREKAIEIFKDLNEAHINGLERALQIIDEQEDKEKQEEMMRFMVNDGTLRM